MNATEKIAASTSNIIKSISEIKHTHYTNLEYALDKWEIVNTSNVALISFDKYAHVTVFNPMSILVVKNVLKYLKLITVNEDGSVDGDMLNYICLLYPLEAVPASI